jgi:hypothetical protein
MVAGRIVAEGGEKIEEKQQIRQYHNRSALKSDCLLAFLKQVEAKGNYNNHPLAKNRCEKDNYMNINFHHSTTTTIT